MAETSTGRRPVKAAPNVYTVLALIAFLLLATTVGYVWYRCSELFGPGNPFSVPGRSTAGWVMPFLP